MYNPTAHAMFTAEMRAQLYMARKPVTLSRGDAMCCADDEGRQPKG